jgi:4-hydroxybenzoyl-CoA thioesterase
LIDIQQRFPAIVAVVLRRRVDFPMVDVAKIVYYPEYFDLAHRFFEESLVEICGIGYPEMMDQKIGFPVVQTEARHIAPLRYGDDIVCTLWVEKVGDKSCTWRYKFANQDGLQVWDARVITVCVDLDTFESMLIPGELADSLRSCGED